MTLVFAAFVILLGVARGGTRFFYCPMTHLAFEASPCSPGHDDGDADSDLDKPAVRTADCCMEKWRANAPTARVHEVQSGSVAPAPIVSILPDSPHGMQIVSARMPFEIARSVRAGPSPPSASERRAALMVFNN